MSKTKNQFRLLLTENQNETGRKLRDKNAFNRIFYLTIQAVIWRGPMASKALNQMIFDADWGELDFMLIDFHQEREIFTFLSCNRSSYRSCCVSTPQAVALADAKKGVSMFL